MIKMLSEMQILDDKGYATYCYEKDRLQLYPRHDDLDAETENKAKELGFLKIWCEENHEHYVEYYVSDGWTPDKYNFLLEICGDVERLESVSLRDASQRLKKIAEIEGLREHFKKMWLLWDGHMEDRISYEKERIQDEENFNDKKEVSKCLVD